MTPRESLPALLQRVVSRREVGAFAAATLANRALPVSASEATPTSGEWTFTDDAGKTVTLAERPERIVADLTAATALWDFGIRPVAVSGWTAGNKADWGAIDPSTPDITASADTGAPDPEKLLLLKPDLFITVFWGNPDNPYGWSFDTPDQYARVNAIAPVIALSAAGRADTNLARLEELAGLLGVDLQNPALSAARDAYTAMVAEFRQAIRARDGLTAMMTWLARDSTFIANPSAWADLAFYRHLGLDLRQPEGVKPEDFWLTISPEQLGNYPVDVIFNPARPDVLTPAELAADPVFGLHPAIRAGQVGVWRQDSLQSYQGLTAGMEHIVTTLRAAEDVTALATAPVS